jgi:transcriptional regulator NrdR family protein
MAQKMVLSEIQSTFMVGIVCSHCKCRHLPVYKTINHDNKIVRYRKCRHCGKSLTSIERLVRK